MSCNAAAVRFSIPEATLRRYIKKQKNEEILPIHGGRFHQTFNKEETATFVDYIREFNARGLGLSSIQIRQLAFQFAEANNIDHRFNKESKFAGPDWLRNFNMTNKLSFRTPEATSTARLMGFNKVAVGRFFDILKDVRLKHGFTSSRIFNADESRLSTVPTKLPKVLTPTGQRRVSKIVSAERGRNTIVVCAMSATGVYVPFLIFARHRMKPELLNGCPPGSKGIAQPIGWMNSDCFIKYLEHFAIHVKYSKDVPVLLIVDNHASHISLGAINFCRENGIVMVGLPPHTSHKLQPLDISFFGPLKTYLAQACDTHLVNHPGEPITDKNIGPLFGTAYGKAATVNNTVKGFQATGIESYNPGIFDDSDYAPAKHLKELLSQIATI
ncbi:hypothetical protein NQ315_007955 [Exocentrus adspersus]|uniref:DDE-1 domain-containing protein n=1 Tax=Exocentrus adspersus TaxID=1586481 RepID=A0AAV8V7Y1_9CUCU|nr:hypothetical protein NQ315_007955 [Exocentrus adspersus]